MSREFVFIFYFVLVFSIVGMWKTFKKAGRSGWEALVPFYGIVIQCEISGINPYWLIVVVVTSMFSFLLPFIGLLLAIFFAIYFIERNVWLSIWKCCCNIFDVTFFNIN